MVCWETGGTEPVYLCEGHAEAQKRRGENLAGSVSSARAAAAGDSVGGVRIKEGVRDANSAGSRVAKPGEANPLETSPAPAEIAAPAAEQIKTEEQRLGPEELPGVQSSEASPAPPQSTPSENRDDASVAFPGTSAVASPEVPVAQSAEQAQTKDDAVATKLLASISNKAAPAAPVAPAAQTAKAARTAKDSSRPPARDLAFGNPAKAMVDEAIWNLAVGDREAFQAALEQGKPAAEAAQAAGGQLAAIHRRIGEYSLKLDAVLSASAKTISVQEAIDRPLEQAMIEIIESGLLTDDEKDAAIQQLGGLQEWAKVGLQTQISPLAAHRGLLTVGERMNWGGPTAISQRLKPAYRALFASLKKTIHAAAPDAQELLERLINLYAAKCDLLPAPAAPTPELIFK